MSKCYFFLLRSKPHQFVIPYYDNMGFPHSSVGKESSCNAGDPGSIPGSGSSAGEWTGYQLQYSWASLVAQLVKNPPAMWVDLGQIPGLGRSPGEGNVLQHAQMDMIPFQIYWVK